MKHGRPFRKLSRSSSHRRALLRNLATSLIAHERIITTRAKAMEIKRYTDALIDSARRAYLADSQRAVGGIEASLFEPADSLPRILGPLVARYSEYPFANNPTHKTAFLVKPTKPQTTNTGYKAPGYSRVHLFGHRIGDGGDRAIVELVANPRDLNARLALMYLPQLKAKVAEIHKQRFTEAGDLIFTNTRENSRLAGQEHFYEKLVNTLEKDLGRYKAAAASYESWKESAAQRLDIRARSLLEKAKLKLTSFKLLTKLPLPKAQILALEERGLFVSETGDIVKEDLEVAKKRYLTEMGDVKGNLSFEYLDTSKPLALPKSGSLNGLEAVDVLDEGLEEGVKSDNESGLGRLFKKLF